MSCEDLLGSSAKLQEAMSEFYEQNEKAANSFTKFVREVLARLKAFFETIINKKSGTAESMLMAKQSAEFISELQKRYDAALLAMREGNAVRNTQNATEGEKVKYSFGSRNSQNIQAESKKVIKILEDNISKISTQNRFDIQADGIVEGVKSEYVNNIFISQGGFAENKNIGRVELSKKGAKSTIFHGYGRNKLIAVSAIKTTIEQGNIISTEKNYENSGVDRYVIAAKGLLNKNDAYLAVVIEGYPLNGNHKQFYLHEVLIKETGSHIMTATQKNADTVSEPVSNNKISHPNQNVNPSDEKTFNQTRTENTTNRELLANALESTIDTTTEEGQEQLKRLKEYKNSIKRIKTLEKQRADLVDKGIVFSGGDDF